MENTKNAPAPAQPFVESYKQYKGTYYIPVHVNHESVIPAIFLRDEPLPTAEKEESEAEE